jgi:hypothetical protein
VCVYSTPVASSMRRTPQWVRNSTNGTSSLPSGWCVGDANRSHSAAELAHEAAPEKSAATPLVDALLKDFTGEADDAVAGTEQNLWKPKRPKHSPSLPVPPAGSSRKQIRTFMRQLTSRPPRPEVLRGLERLSAAVQKVEDDIENQTAPPIAFPTAAPADLPAGFAPIYSATRDSCSVHSTPLHPKPPVKSSSPRVAMSADLSAWLLSHGKLRKPSADGTSATLRSTLPARLTLPKKPSDGVFVSPQPPNSRSQTASVEKSTAQEAFVRPGATTAVSQVGTTAAASVSLPSTAGIRAPTSARPSTASDIPFSLWTSAFQRQRNLNVLIESHLSSQQAYERAEAHEIQQHKAALESMFAAAEAQGRTKALFVPTGMSHGFATRRAWLQRHQALSDRAMPMPLLNYKAGDSQIRVQLATIDPALKSSRHTVLTRASTPLDPYAYSRVSSPTPLLAIPLPTSTPPEGRPAVLRARTTATRAQAAPAPSRRMHTPDSMNRSPSPAPPFHRRHSVGLNGAHRHSSPTARAPQWSHENSAQSSSLAAASLMSPKSRLHSAPPSRTAMLFLPQVPFSPTASDQETEQLLRQTKIEEELLQREEFSQDGR